MSVGPGGVQGRLGSDSPVVSADGRFVAFTSDADNLIPGDSNGVADVFVRDRQMDTTTRVSLGPGGAQGNGSSFVGSISADGRLVAFTSDADNLVPGDSNGATDIFVRDRQMGTTTRVSVRTDGGQGNDASFVGSISADGRFVAFDSWATNLVPGDTNGFRDVFVRDRRTGVTSRVSLGPGGDEGGGESYLSSSSAVSADGRFIAFYSDAPNLVRRDTNHSFDVFVRDRQTGTTQRVSLGTGGVEGRANSFSPSISADGRFVTFYSEESFVPGDTNGVDDVFVRDRQTGTTRRVSLGTGGVQGNDASSFPAISADGRFVTFQSQATNLVPGDTNRATDIFVRDRRTGTTKRVSVRTGGGQANRDSDLPAISADGGLVAFASGATNLVPHDTNKAVDVFVRTLSP